MSKLETSINRFKNTMVLNAGKGRVPEGVLQRYISLQNEGKQITKGPGRHSIPNAVLAEVQHSSPSSSKTAREEHNKAIFTGLKYEEEYGKKIYYPNGISTTQADGTNIPIDIFNNEIPDEILLKTPSFTTNIQETTVEFVSDQEQLNHIRKALQEELSNEL